MLAPGNGRAPAGSRSVTLRSSPGGTRVAAVAAPPSTVKTAWPTVEPVLRTVASTITVRVRGSRVTSGSPTSSAAGASYAETVACCSGVAGRIRIAWPPPATSAAVMVDAEVTRTSSTSIGSGLPRQVVSAVSE